MAKKKTTKKFQSKTSEVSLDNVLPQNIVLIGERVEEDKNIYIAQSVYKEIHKFTKDKTTNESGGVLLGTVIEEFGKTNIVIKGFIEAKYCEGTPTTLKFTHESWEYIHKEADKRFPNYKILGWIHTHPNFGIFLSEYDKFIQENFFKEDNQIAYVVDPIQGIEGFYFWINGKIERCKGFYVFDKTGVKITVNESENEKTDATPTASSSLTKNLFTGILAVAVVVLIVICISLNGKINNLQKQQEALVDSASQSLVYMQQQISSLSSEVAELKATTNEINDTNEEEDDDNNEANESENEGENNSEQIDNSTDNSSTTDTSVSEPENNEEGDNNNE